MQRSVWMRPALQKSEAVLLPALQRRMIGEPQFSDPYSYTYLASGEDPFLPLDGTEMTATASQAPEPTGAMTTALSTYVRPRGSMAGRSVLRAAGVPENRWSWQNNRTGAQQRNRASGGQNRNQAGNAAQARSKMPGSRVASNPVQSAGLLWQPIHAYQ